MRKEDIIFIEQELAIRLTAAYKSAALEAKMAGTLNSSLFYDDAKKIVDVNKRLRKNGIYGQPWCDNHFVIGYRSDGGDYYFIDLNIENGHVYQANRTKGWKYTPNDISYNESPYETIGKYVDNFYKWAKRVEDRENSTQPEPTPEEKKLMLMNFFAEIKSETPNIKKSTDKAK